MAALIGVFLVVLVSLLITRVATVALALTGMSRESAHFQARSAFFGVGFTPARQRPWSTTRSGAGSCWR